MKVSASVAALAFAASVVAAPWEAAPASTTTTTTTTTTASGTWADWTSVATTTTTTKTAPATSTTAAETWADWEEPASWTSTVVPVITTFAPEATSFVHAGKTYSCTGASTFTIAEGGPFTISVPIFTSVSTSCEAAPASATTWADWESSSSAAPVAPQSYAPTGTGVAPATFTGAANSLVANVGAGLAGVGAIAAFLL